MVSGLPLSEGTVLVVQPDKLASFNVFPDKAYERPQLWPQMPGNPMSAELTADTQSRCARIRLLYLSPFPTTELWSGVRRI